MPRYYMRQLRASLAAQPGTSGALVVDYPDLRAPALNGAYTNGVTTAVVLDDTFEDEVVGLGEPLAAETALDTADAGSAGRRRRRRGRRGHGRNGAVVDGVTVLEAAPAAPATPGQSFVEDLPPSSHLAAMVQSGTLVLPEPRNRRRRRYGDRDRDYRDGREPADAGVGAGSAMTGDFGERGGARPNTVESLLRQQFVRLDQLVQKQDRLLATMEEMLRIMQRRGGMGGGGGGTMAPPQRVAVFVDVPNIVYAADRIAARIDWGKVLNFLTRDRQLVRATAYSPVTDDPRQRVDLQRFVQPFHDLPFRILTKPLKRFGNGEIKANFDVELAIDVVTMADRLDVVSLVSGDGDFRRMVEIVQAKGVRVEVMAFSSSTASELRQVCDTYIDFNQHLHELTIEG